MAKYSPDFKYFTWNPTPLFIHLIIDLAHARCFSGRPYAAACKPDNGDSFGYKDKIIPPQTDGIRLHNKTVVYRNSIELGLKKIEKQS
ncbi:MAG: hypothetical protein EA409_02245 [Saprospirales bacterium]|nr:MAG: hypothetical protein EA409_02245 [Saprospirales bacterium]